MMPSSFGKKEDLLTSSAIYNTAASEGKGGPRVSDVIDLMVDLNTLKEVKHVSEIPVCVGKQYCYLTLQGIENN